MSDRRKHLGNGSTMQIGERRTLERIQTSGKNDFTAELETEQGPFVASVMNLSSKGMGLQLRDHSPTSPAIERVLKLTLKYGRKVVAEIQEPSVRHFSKDSGQLGLDLTPKANHNPIARQSERLKVNIRVEASVMCTDPVQFGVAVYCKVVDVSLDGMLLSASLVNKHLVAGMTLSNAQLILPLVGIFEVSLQVRHVRQDGETLLIGVQFSDSTPALAEGIAKYAVVACHHQANDAVDFLSTLRSAKISVRNIGSSVRFHRVTSREDIVEMLQVRFAAYENASKVAPGTTAWDMADSYDDHSLNFNIHLNGFTVATFRLVYSKNITQQFPFEKYFPYPTEDAPPREKVVEICRLAILPEFQRTNLLNSIFQFIAMEAGKENSCLIIMATQSLRPLYKKIGATELPGEVPHPQLDDDPMALLLLSVDEYIRGTNVTEKVWDATYSKAVEHFNHFGFFDAPAKEAHPVLLKMLSETVNEVSTTTEP